MRRLMILALALLLAAWLMLRRSMVYVMVDKQPFLVRDAPGKDEVAARLAHLQRQTVQLLRLIGDDPRGLRLQARWSGHISEISYWRAAEAGYTTGKKDVSLCIRDAQGELVDGNTSMYVHCHELAHIVSDSHGHTAEFWKNFRWLLAQAARQGIYHHVAYGTTPTTICGHRIEHNPLTCVLNKTCRAD